MIHEEHHHHHEEACEHCHGHEHHHHHEEGGVKESIVKIALATVLLIAAVIRGGKSIVPDGSMEIQAEDHVVLVAESGKIATINDMMRGAS